MTNFSIGSTSTARQRLIESSEGNINPTVPLNVEFECGVLQKLSLFCKLGLSVFQCKVQSKIVFNWIDRFTFEVAHWALNSRNQTCTCLEMSVWMSIGIKIHSTFSDFSVYQYSDARIETESLSLEDFAASSKLSVGNLIEEIEHMVMEQASNRKKSFFKANSYILALAISLEDFRLIPGRKNWNVFFWVKIEFQLLGENWGLSILFALFDVSSMWEFQKGIFQQFHFRNFFRPGETKIANKTYPGKKLK